MNDIVRSALISGKMMGTKAAVMKLEKKVLAVTSSMFPPSFLVTIYD